MDERVDRTRRTYDEVAPRFLANTRDRSRMLPWLRRFAGWLDAGARVLDLGAGPGFDAAALRGLGLEALAVDLSRGMLRAGLAEFPGPRVQGDIRCLPFADRTFDGVWANASLLHLSPQDAAAALREARRVLRPRGLMHVSVKAGDGAGWESQRYGRPRWFQYWTAEALDALLVDAGLAVVGSWSNTTPRDRWLVRHAEPSPTVSRSRAGSAPDRITLRPLTRTELAGVWSLDRGEVVERVFGLEDGALVLRREHHDVKGWPPGEPERDGPTLLDCFDAGGPCRGAFDGATLVGVFVLERRFIGRRRDRLQLKFLHVSRSHRGSGVGRALFEAAVAEARALGARSLYVSATPSENTIRFYLRRGCRLAEEVDAALFAREPEDIHLEYAIPGASREPTPEAEPRGG